MRNRAQIEADDAANLARAKAQPGRWINYEPRKQQGGGQKEKFAEMGLAVRKNDNRLQICYQLAPALSSVAPSAESICLECDYHRERVRLSIEMIRIKDELITKQMARIIHLEGRK
jgi:hypothetical protein